VITVRAVVADGNVVRLRSNGHAARSHKGQNLACGAATVLLRTAARLFTEHEGMRCRGSLPAEGSLELEVEITDPASQGFAAGVSAFVLKGLADLSAEYPGEFDIEITEKGS